MLEISFDNSMPLKMGATTVGCVLLNIVQTRVKSSVFWANRIYVSQKR